MPFTDRRDAGRRLGDALQALRLDRPVVLALPRGGVPVAYEVAAALARPRLDVLVVRKLGAPYQPELRIGAIGEGGVRVLNDVLIQRIGESEAEVETTIAHELAELDRRVRRYRLGRPPAPVEGRTVVVVDDGLATGATATAAVRIVRRRGASRVVLAVPVSSREALAALRGEVDDVVCVETPATLMAIGQWYHDFTQVSDDEVVALLEAAVPGTTTVRIPCGALSLPGELTTPDEAKGLVIFSHGSGSSRHSPRNKAVAAALADAGLATLLFDLLTEEEASDRRQVFDVELLADRLTAAVTWARTHPRLASLPVGLFGASTGAAAALVAAACLPDDIVGVVSRGGRPDLAGAHLPQVTANTLLIVGGDDSDVLALNREAQRALRCPNTLAVVPDAGHLFEERGALETVADLAKDHFLSTM